MGKYNTHPDVTFISIQGKLVLSGTKQSIGNGARIVIFPNAELILGDHVYVNNLAKIVTRDKIEIQDYVSISWECQILDANFHYMLHEQGFVSRDSKGISIGKHCWIGNRSTLGPGTKLADWCIVASNSLLNKDFSPNERCLVSGCPAKVVKEGVRRVHNTTTEKIINNFFLENKGAQRYIVTDDIEMHYS